METATVYYQVYVGQSTLPEASFLRYDHADNWLKSVYSAKVREGSKIARVYVDNSKSSYALRQTMHEATNLLRDMIDGGEECKGMDAAISEVIRVLEVA